MDVPKFKRGKILVVHTVATWMTSAVEKASAIITEAGGVLSHTAVVAREFRKPCITGTKVATQVLRDGMQVIVDANGGVVTVKKQ